MLDITVIRDNPARVKKLCLQKNVDAPIDDILALDETRRQTLGMVEELKAKRNAGSKEIGRVKDSEERQRLIADMGGLGDRIAELDTIVRETEVDLRTMMLGVPNLPDPNVPVGPDAESNTIYEQKGDLPAFDFEPKPHWEIAEILGIIDFERGVKVAGSRFHILRGLGARLERALITWMLDLHIERHSYEEVAPPYLVLGEMLVGTGNIPKFGDNLFRDIEEDRWLIPTAEVPVTNMYRDEILDEGHLPIYHVAYTPCFRREQLSGGRDVRGIKRGYQFDKVEMVKFVHPDRSAEEHARLTQEAADVLEALELPYRVLQMCTGDLSFTAANKVDLEVWAPGSEEWLEVSSCSNFRDFQARRANLRFRPADGGRPQFLHTLNGSGLALPRTLIAIMENYQRPDGSFDVPEVLKPYLRGVEVVERNDATTG